MASAHGDIEEYAALTRREREFIVQALQNLQLRGTPEVLRDALKLVDGICSKLSASQEDPQAGDG